MVVLRFLLIFFLVIFVISYILRILVRVFFKRMESNFSQQQGRNPRPEGDVSVSKPPKHDKLVDKDVGDYIDYEEVDE
jgi:hypothetical protein